MVGALREAGGRCGCTIGKQLRARFKKDIHDVLDKFATALPTTTRTLVDVAARSGAGSYIDFDELPDNVDRFVAVM